MTDPTPAPALALPAIAAHCPQCGATPGDLCTSHSGERVRRHDVHQARTRAHRDAHPGAHAHGHAHTGAHEHAQEQTR